MSSQAAGSSVSIQLAALLSEMLHSAEHSEHIRLEHEAALVCLVPHQSFDCDEVHALKALPMSCCRVCAHVFPLSLSFAAWVALSFSQPDGGISSAFCNVVGARWF